MRLHKHKHILYILRAGMFIGGLPSSTSEALDFG